MIVELITPYHHHRYLKLYYLFLIFTLISGITNFAFSMIPITYQNMGDVSEESKQNQIDTTTKASAVIPRCFKEAGEHRLPLKIQIIGGNKFSSFINGIPDDTFGGLYFMGQITLPSGIYSENRLKSMSQYEDRKCTPPGTILKTYSNLERVLFHEAAHHFHLSNDDNMTWIYEFLSLGGKEKINGFEEDAELRSRAKSLEKLRMEWSGIQMKIDILNKSTIPRRKKAQDDMGRTLPPTQAKKELSEAHSKLSELEQKDLTMREQYNHLRCENKKYEEEVYMQRYNLPSRFHGDTHASAIRENGGADPWGAEYFAMALELMIYDHPKFCSTFSPEEITFLYNKLGSCFLEAQLPVANCFNEPITRN